MIITHTESIWYKVIAIILCLALVIAITINPIQHAKAIVATSTAVIAVVLALLAAWGLITVATDMTSDNIESYIDGKLQEYAEFVQSPVETLFNGNRLKLTADGLIIAGAYLVNNVKAFANWLFSDESLTVGQQTTVVSVVGNMFSAEDYLYDAQNLGELVSHGLVFTNTYNNQAGVIQFGSITSDSPVYFKFGYENGGKRLVIISQSQFTVDVTFISRYIDTAHANNIFNYQNKHSSTINLYGIEANVTSISFGSNYSFLPGISSFNSVDEAYQQFVTNPSIGYQLDLYPESTYQLPADVGADYGVVIDTGYTGSSVGDIADSIMTDVVGNSLEVTTSLELIPTQQGVIIENDSDQPVPVVLPDGTIVDTNVNGLSNAVQQQLQAAIQAAIEASIEQGIAVDAEITNSAPISVNTDHHLFGLTFPSFNLNLASIWHYVTDAFTAASSGISLILGIINTIPFITMPLYMSLTIMIVFGVFKRFL